MVILDNSIISFAGNLNNGIHIPSYFGQKDDIELRKVTDLLKLISNCSNIQEEIQTKIGLSIMYDKYLEEFK